MLVLPLLKTDYNLPRLWLQALIIFSPLVVFGGIKLLTKFPKFKFQLIAILVAVFLLYSSGVIPYVTTGTASAMFSNNSNDYYLYYTTKGEVLAAQWLGSQHTNLPIYSDQLASLKLLAYGNVTNTQEYIYHLL